ncbi:hypothetical protein HDV05_001344 [Chytridiales sp. JEL 0842]|nr:hypothetical protein HDV05_001344 [Chytridiales sp. JEL 0842]
MEYAVQKSTSKKLAPLKEKHVVTLKECTWHRELPDLFRILSHRIREPNWVVVFKSLILIHILIREGATDRVMQLLVSSPHIVDTSDARDKSLSPLSVAQMRNIRSYSKYLASKISGYKQVKVDFVRLKPESIARFRSLPIEEGLLDEVQCLQSQISALLECSFYLEEIDNVVTLQSFRLLVGDMMSLFHLLNEGVIRILGSYFEMEKPYAQKSLQIYKSFAQQTAKVVEFFDIARRLRQPLGIDIPQFKHAPVSLAGALEDYLKAPDFEAQRQAYKVKKASKESMKQGKSSNEKSKSNGHAAKPVEFEASFKPEAPKSPKKVAPKEPLIDFFSSLDAEINAYTSPTTQAAFDFNQQALVWGTGGGFNNFGNNSTLQNSNFGNMGMPMSGNFGANPAQNGNFGATGDMNMFNNNPFGAQMGQPTQTAAFNHNNMQMSNPFAAANMMTNTQQSPSYTNPTATTTMPQLTNNINSVATSSNVMLDPFAMQKVGSSQPGFTVENVFGAQANSGQLGANNSMTITGSSSGFSNPFQQSSAAGPMKSGGTGAAKSTQPQAQVQDPLAVINPFAKPSIPLAQMKQQDNIMGLGNASFGTSNQFSNNNSTNMGMMNTANGAALFSHSGASNGANMAFGSTMGNGGFSQMQASAFTTQPAVGFGGMSGNMMPNTSTAGLTNQTTGAFNPFMMNNQQQQQPQQQQVFF